MNKALFLDRDGIINIDKGYVCKSENFEFIEGIFDVCRYVSEQGYQLVVVTNQAGIGRGYYTEHDFQDLCLWMVNQFAKHKITISAIYHCPYHPEAGIGAFRQNSFDRKPNPGMFLRAQGDLDLDLSKSMLLGDKESDIEAAINACIGCSVLIGAPDSVESTKASNVFQNLVHALHLGIDRSKSRHVGYMHIRGRDGDSIEGEFFCGAGVMGKNGGETQIKCSPDGSIHTHVTHHAADEQAADVVCFESFQQISITETVRIMLDDNRFSGKRTNRIVDLSPWSAWQKELCPRLHGDMLYMVH